MLEGHNEHEANADERQQVKGAHAVSAEVTDVIAADEHGDHFPVVLEINALWRKNTSTLLQLAKA